MFVSLQNNNGSQKISGDALKDLYKSFVSEYPIVSIEDPFDQDDWEHYAKMTAECGDNVQIVGDDLLVTNPKVCNLTRCSYHFLSLFVLLIFVYTRSSSRELPRQSQKSLAMLFSWRLTKSGQ